MEEENFNISNYPPTDYEKYDLCLVFRSKSSENGLDELNSAIINQIFQLIGKNHTYLYYSEDFSQIICLLRPSLRLLKLKAEEDGVEMKLDPDVAREMARQGNSERNIDPFIISTNREVSKFDPYEYIFAEYNPSMDIQNLYWRPDNSNHPFHKSLRIKMLLNILSKESERLEYNLTLEYLKKAKVIENFFPIHSEPEKRDLAYHWKLNQFTIWKQPYEQISDYFGAKIAFYFLFLGTFLKMLLIPTSLGVVYQVLLFFLRQFQEATLPAFALFISILFILFESYWKHEQKIRSMMWNTTNKDREKLVNDIERYEYTGLPIKSFIDGSDMIFFSPFKRIKYYVLSFFVVFICILVSLVATTAIFYLRYMVSNTFLGFYHQWIASGVIALKISIFNRIFYAISCLLTHLENHRTDTEYNQSLIFKFFVLQFVNTFSSFYFLAFGQKLVTDKYNPPEISLGSYGFHDSLDSVTINLMIVLGAQTFFGALYEHILPYLFLNFFCIVNGRKSYHSTINPRYELGLIDEDDGDVDLNDDRIDNRSGRIPSPRNTNGDASMVLNTPEEDEQDISQDIETQVFESSEPEPDQEAAMNHADTLRSVESLPGFDRDVARDYGSIVHYYYEFDQLHQLNLKYSRIINRLALVFLFGISLPASFLIVFLSLMVEIKFDIWKFTQLYKRPISIDAENIGEWQQVLGFLVIAAVCTNAALIVFTLEVFITFKLWFQLCIFIGFVALCFSLRYLLQLLSPSVPNEVLIQRKRSNFLNKKLVLQIPDRPDAFPTDIL